MKRVLIISTLALLLGACYSKRVEKTVDVVPQEKVVIEHHDYDEPIERKKVVIREY